MRELSAVAPAGSAYKAWAAVLGVSPANDFAVLLLRASEVLQLAKDIREQANDAIPDDVEREFALRDFGQVDAMLKNFASIGNPNLTLTHFLAPLEETGKRCLEHLSFTLGRAEPDEVIGPEDEAALLTEVHDLIAAVANDDSLEPNTKTWILTRLREIESALLNVKVTGKSGVEGRLDRLLGGIIRRKDRQLALHQSNTGAAVWKWISRVSIVLGLSVRLLALSEDTETPDVMPALDSYFSTQYELTEGNQPSPGIVDAEIDEDFQAPPDSR